MGDGDDFDLGLDDLDSEHPDDDIELEIADLSDEASDVDLDVLDAVSDMSADVHEAVHEAGPEAPQSHDVFNRKLFLTRGDRIIDSREDLGRTTNCCEHL